MQHQSTQPESNIIYVEPVRLQSGLWSYEEGDISRSYSADVYGMNNQIRKPFTHASQLYVSMGAATGALGIYAKLTWHCPAITTPIGGTV